MKKILIVPDIPGWAVDSMCDGIISALKDRFDFTVKYSDKMSTKMGKPVINWKEDYEKYDIIYLMMSGYLPKNLPDYSKICTTFHGGPATESQANILQNHEFENMRMSYISEQTKHRVTIYPFSKTKKTTIKIKNNGKPNIAAVKKKFGIRKEDKCSISSIGGNRVSISFTKIGFGLTNLCFTPQGIDIDKFYQKEVRDDFVAGYAGWLQYLEGAQKDHRRGHWIMNAWNKGDFKLSIAAGSKDFGGARNQIKRFKPFVNQYKKIEISLYNKDEMPNFYKGISCYLVPDKFAGGPLPVLEAGAMGIPVICTNAGLCGDIIENNIHGKVINNYGQFYEAIEWMKKSPIKRKKMGENLREYIREYRTWDAVAPYWEEFFNGV